MEHVVFFPTADGSPAFRRLPTLEEAVRLVEHLRNVEGVDSVSVHALAEVPLQFKAYYRVEVPTPLDAAPVVPAQAPQPPSEQAPAPLELVAERVSVEPLAELEPVPSLALVEQAPAVEEEPTPAYAASNGHSSGGVASLGFFA